MEYEVDLTWEQFLKELNESASNYGACNWADSFADLPLDEQHEIKDKYYSIYQFSFLTQDVLEQQLADYDDGYIGEDTKVGDLVWFDGECECCEATVDGWYNQTHEIVADKNTWANWVDVAELVKESFILAEFKKHRESITQK